MRERGRTRRLLGLGARTGGALLKTRLGGQADWRALGEALFEGLSELKGPAMKLAQIMSQWDDLLPPDLANELARLQRQQSQCLGRVSVKRWCCNTVILTSTLAI